MKKRQNNSTRASALQITLSVALLSLSAIVFASSFRAAPPGFYPPLPAPAASEQTGFYPPLPHPAASRHAGFYPPLPVPAASEQTGFYPPLPLPAGPMGPGLNDPVMRNKLHPGRQVYPYPDIFSPTPTPTPTTCLTAQDNFNRADGDLGPNWTANLDPVLGGFTLSISGNQVAPPIGRGGVSHWNANVFGADQYSQVRLTGVIGNDFAGAVVRGSTSPSRNYVVAIKPDGAHLYAFVTPDFFELVFNPTSWATGDLLKLEVRTIVAGTAHLIVYRNGAPLFTFDDATHFIASGQPGLGLFQASTVALDDWEGGDLSCPTPTPAPTPTPTPTPTPAPTATPTGTPTPTATPAPTATPTGTPAPTATATPTPLPTTPTPSPTATGTPTPLPTTPTPTPIGTGTITVLPTAITFNGVAGGAFPAPQSIQITTSNGAPWHSFDNSPWFDAHRTSGVSGGSITLYPHTEGLGAGTLMQNITFSAAGCADKVVVVTLVLTPPGTPGPTPTATPAAAITVLPAAITFNGVAGGAFPAPQSIQITASTAVSWTSFDTSPWFDAYPTRGFSGASTTLYPHPSGLVAGTYVENITFSAAGCPDKVVVVTLVLAPGGTPAPTPVPGISVLPAAITFNGVAGGAFPAPQSIQVTASTAVPWTSFDTSPWFDAYPTRGPSGASTTLYPHPAGLAAGTYTEDITFSAAGYPDKVVVVTLVLTPGGTPAPTPVPAITVLPEAITFNGVAGGAFPAPQSIQITPSNGSTWTSFDTSPWFDAFPTRGPSGASTTLFPHTGGLGVGTYTENITFSAAGLPGKVVVVTLILTSPSSEPAHITYGGHRAVLD